MQQFTYVPSFLTFSCDPSPLPAGGMRCLQLFSLSFFSFGIRKNFFAASEEIMTQKQKKGREGEYFYVLSAQPP